jgi:hypothetical protein
MTRDEMLKVLKDSFKDFKFYEDGHYYTYKDKPVGISVTRFIAEYENEFDQLGVAEKVSIKENRPIEDILAEWKYKADFACAKGTLCHEFAQHLWSGNKISIESAEFDDSYEWKEYTSQIFEQAVSFHYNYKDRFEHLVDELPIGSEEYDIASCVDHLFYNKLTGGLVLVDYKTNSTLKGYNDAESNRRYTKKMKVPLHKIDDDSLHHYYIQLSIYKFLIEKYTGLKVDEMFIVYMSENIENYEIIEIPYLKDEVEKILENRRIKNMNSVPVLLIGASGTGKSTSLRNFTKDELAVVNVLGKPLPFKSDIKAPKIDDYQSILKAIQGTKKKTIVIDDAGYLITNEFMNKSSIKGYDKYNEIANNFFNLINAIKNIDGGKTVYLVMHEDSNEDGDVKPKTIGKLLDDKVNIQGMFTVCIRSMFDNGNYIFRLKTNGQDCVKTPFGMFETETMENDLKEFDKVVREYYDLDNEESEKEGEE